MSMNLLLRSILDFGYTVTKGECGCVQRIELRAKKGNDYQWCTCGLVSGHFYGAGAENVDLNALFASSMKEVWIDKALCVMAYGKELGTLTSPMMGLQMQWLLSNNHGYYMNSNYKGPMRYWFGSLKDEIISEATLIHFNHECQEEGACLGRYGSIVHYSMTAFEEPKGIPFKCQGQPHLRGLKHDCGKDKWNDTHTSWYYDLNVVRDPPGFTLWIFPSQKTTVVQQRVHTIYTMAQFFLGIIGACVGISGLQIIEVALQAFEKWKPNKKKFTSVLRVVAVVALLVATVTMTTIDMNSYVKGRYAKQFRKREESSLPNPVVNFCNEKVEYAYLDATLLDKYEVSMELFAFLKKFGLRKTGYAWNAFMYRKEMDEFLYRKEMGQLNVTFHNYSLKNYNFPPNEPKNNFTVFPEKSGYVGLAKNFKHDEKYFNYALREVIWEHNIHMPGEDWVPPMMLLGPDFNESKFAKFKASILAELEALGRKLGLEKDAPIFKYIDALSVVPKIISVPQCVTGKCQLKIRNNYGTRARDICFTIEIISDEPLIKKTGNDHGIDIILDGPTFMTTSDAFAYLGPGVRELQEGHREFECTLETKDIEGNVWANQCDPYSANFNLNIYHPEGKKLAQNIILTHFHKKWGIDNAISFKLSYESLLPQSSDCTDTVKELSLQTDQVLPSLVVAVQSVVFCDCTFCEVPELGPVLDHIMGRHIPCCTGSTALDCYRLHAKNINKLSDKDYDLSSNSGKVLANWEERINKTYFLNLDTEKVIEREQVDNLFINCNQLTNEAKDRFVQYVQSVFRLRCNTKQLVPGTLQLNPIIEGKESRVRIYYSDNVADGLEEKDVLNVVQFLAVLSCTFSLTFGFGVIGLAEAVLSAYIESKKSNGKLSLASFQKHILKCLLQLFAANAPNHPPNANQVGPGNPHAIEASEAASSEADSIDDDQPGCSHFANKPMAKVHEDGASSGPKPKPTSETETESRNEIKAGSDETDKDEPGCSHIANEPLAMPHKDESSTSSRPKNTDDTSHSSGGEDDDGSEAGGFLRKFYEAIMLGALVFCLLGFGGLLTGFLLYSASSSSTIEIVKYPKYQLPYIGLCSKNASTAHEMLQILERTKCYVRDNDFPISCSHRFTLYYTTSTSVCAVGIEGDVKKLDVTEPDLIIEAPRKDNYFFWVSGTNRTAAIDHSGSFQWADQDLTVNYAVSLNWDQTGNCSETSESEEFCPACGDQDVDFKMCCLHPQYLRGKFAKKACYDYDYAISVAVPKSNNPDLKNLTLRAKSEIVPVFIEYYPLTGIEYTAMIGGLLGVTLELTFLHGVVVLLAALLVCLRALVNFGNKFA